MSAEVDCLAAEIDVGLAGGLVLAITWFYCHVRFLQNASL